MKHGFGNRLYGPPCVVRASRSMRPRTPALPPALRRNAHKQKQPSGFPKGRDYRTLILNDEAFIPPRESATRVHSNPDSADNDAPTVRLRAASPESVGHNCRSDHTRHPRFDKAPRQSILKAAGRWSTSTSTTLSYKRWRPYPPGPASLPRRVHGCKLRPLAPRRQGLRAASIIFLDKFLLFSCPFIS